MAYKCELCEKAYAQKFYLQQHEKTKHSNATEAFNRLCVHQIKVRGKGKITDFDETWVG